MGAQGRAQPKVGIRMALLQAVSGRCEISEQVNPCRQKIRDHQDALGPLSHATIPPLPDIGFRQFEETGLDDRIRPSFPKTRGELVQIVIGRRMPAAMGDQKDSRRFFEGRHSRSTGVNPRAAVERGSHKVLALGSPLL